LRKAGQGGSTYGQSTASGSGYSSQQGSGIYAQIRNHVNEGNLDAAEGLLRGVAEAERNAEWNFLMGCVMIRKGHFVDAQRLIDNACAMDPSNQEYRAARDRLRMQAQGYGAGYRTNHDVGCSACDICSSLICADCCCECMGGDLIRCC
jgi:hypothetical protein